MNCQTVRERLLTASLAALDDDIERHLAGCAACTHVVERLKLMEDALRQEIDQFSQATPKLDPPSPPQRPPRRGLYLGLLVAAAAMALLAPWLASRINGPTEAPQAASHPSEVAANEAWEAFEAVPIEGFEVTNLERREEDRALVEALRTKAGAFEEAKSALDPLGERDPLEAAVRLAEIHEHMGDSLLAFQRPSYLNDKQRPIYDAQMHMKAEVQLELAIAHWQEAAELARESGETGVIEEAEEAEARLEAWLDNTMPGKRITLGKAMAGHLASAHESLAEAVEACGNLPDDLRTAINTDLAETSTALEDESFELYSDLEHTLRAHRKTLTTHCPSND